MASEPTPASNGLRSSRHSRRRGKMRNGTFVIPATGERSRRQFTLRPSSDLSSANHDESAFADTEAETTAERAQVCIERIRDKTLALLRFLNSNLGHGVMKCVLAYFLGSLATFWTPLSSFLGNRDGKHIVATLTVYFHPARTAGSMLEAILIAFIAVAYAELICVLSMGVTIASRNHLGLVGPAHVFVLVVSIGGGLGFVGWVKQKMNSPLVNVASTLASIAIISVVTKEESIQDGYFSEDKIVQVLKMLVLGICFTVAVNLLVWRVSARRVLRQAIVTASDSLGDKLSFITRGFLNGSEEDLTSPDYAYVTARYNSSYTLMTSMIREAKFEHYFLGREKIYKLDKRLVMSVEAVSQAIGGLRSALETQLTLLRETPTTVPQPPSKTMCSKRKTLTRSASALIDKSGKSLSIIDESDEEHAGMDMSASQPDLLASQSTPTFRSPSDIFELFIALLGPSMKSLAYTLSETLREPPFGDDPLHDVTVKDQLRDSLRDALRLYDSARGAALHELYRGIELGRSRSEKIQADIEEVAAACGHFSFSLLAVAQEMDCYLDVLEDLKDMYHAPPLSWDWLYPSRLFSRGRNQQSPIPDPERENLIKKTPAVKTIKRNAVPKGMPASMVKRRDTFSWEAAPQASGWLRLASQKLLTVLRFLAREDVLFGIKVGIGAILWAMLAFIPSTRPIYQHWRGEWGLLSYMIVVAMTTGASNTTSTARLMGTVAGAAYACISWYICFDNPYALAFVGCLVALGNFYVILVLKNPSLGRISLLAYNVIVLYAYSISQDVDDDDDDEGGTDPFIFNIAYHRVLAVTFGIIWGMIVVRLLWPISGREKFRGGLSTLYLQLGLIWKRGPLGILIAVDGKADYLREGEQQALQRYAFRLDALRTSAKSEFELRGPFPYNAYGRILHSTKHILDGFYAMRLITQRRHDLSSGERALLVHTQEEREALCQRICHVFQVLASCIMLEYPLTDVIPTIDNNRDRLLNKIYMFRKGKHQNDSDENDDDNEDEDEDEEDRQKNVEDSIAEEKDYALVYAYTLVTAQVAEELKKVRAEIEDLFGVLHEEAHLLE